MTARRTPSACIVLMGSGAETARETAAALRRAGEKVGVLQVRLYPPVRGRRICSPRCPQACRAIAVLEQTKEPGATGEPLYLDVVATLAQAVAQRQRADYAAGDRRPLRPVVEGFHPGMAKAVFDELTEADAEERLHRRHQRRRHAYQPRRRPGVSDRAGRRGARGVLRPGRRRHGRRQQEQRQDHRRGCRAAMRRAISSTIRTNRARRPFRICASARSRSTRPT